MLVEVTDPDTGEGRTDKQVRDETIGFSIAGHATIASALTGTWYLLSTRPEAWRRLRAEVDEVLGDGPPAVADLPRLAWTTTVVQEAMRLYPPICLVLRRAVADDEVGGHRIPAGTNIALCPYVTHAIPGSGTTPRASSPSGSPPRRPAPGTAWLLPVLGRSPPLHRRGLRPAPAPAGGHGAQRYRLSLLPARPAEVETAVTLRPRALMLMRVDRVA